MNMSNLLRPLALLLGAAGVALFAPACVAAADSSEPMEQSDSNTNPVAYGSTSIFGIHFHPNPDAPLPDWLGGGSRKVWVTELAASGDSFDWFHYQGYCYDNTTCGAFKKIAAQNTQLIARIDYNRGAHYSVPQDWNTLWDWKVLVHDRLFVSNDGTPITRYAPTILIGNEVNLCGENDMPESCGITAPAQKSTRPDWYAEVYRQMRGYIHSEATASGYGDVAVMMQGASPAGYGGTRYMNYVLNNLCNDTVDSIALHGYGWLDSAGGDGTYGLSGDIAAQLRGVDEACNGKFRNVPVVITEFSRGTRPVPDSDFVGKTYAWINAWNADSNHHGIAGATYFVGRGPGFPEENITVDSPNDHHLARASFKAATGNDWKARTGGAPSGPLGTGNECSTGGPSSTFSQTGYTLSGSFNTFWNQNGGLGVFGYPISNARMETNSSGFTVCTQWFERQRLELSNGSVLLGLLGSERSREDYQQISTQGAFATKTSAPAGCRLFPETKHTVCNGFKSYWEGHGLVSGGSLMLFGYPVSEEFYYKGADGKQYAAQYFERARFEWHPENSAPYDILQGRLGAEIYRNER
ncbi:MAG: hypothetical protein ACMG6S_16380 [Byssovorax sp.]